MKEYNSNTRKCIHDTLLKNCKICRGTSICIHNRERYRCRDCKGKGSCEHKHDKRWCSICTKIHTPAIIRKMTEKRRKNSHKKKVPRKKEIAKIFEKNDYFCIHGYIKKKCCICEYNPIKINYTQPANTNYDWINTKKSNIHELNYKYLESQFRYDHLSHIEPPLRLGLFRRDRVVDFLNKYRKRN